jgi:hypothetical protein
MSVSTHIGGDLFDVDATQSKMYHYKKRMLFLPDLRWEII